MSGRRTSFKLVNDAREVASRFKVGDRVSLSYTSDSYPGVVTKVEAEIGKVWVDFSGNVKQMDPFEIRHDATESIPIKEQEVFTVKARRAQFIPAQIRQAIYHIQPGRNYKLTRKEQDDGVAYCPRCRAEMTQKPFARGIQLFDCPDCEFKITTDHLFDSEYAAPAGEPEVVVEEVSPVMASADPGVEAASLATQLSNIQQVRVEELNRTGKLVQDLASQAAGIERSMLALARRPEGAKALAAELENNAVNTGEMNSTTVGMIERNSGVSLFPTPWRCVKPAYAVITANTKRQAAAGPLTLLEQLRDALTGNKLNEEELRMYGHGFGHTPGADFIFGEAGEEIVWALLGYAANRKSYDDTMKAIRKHIDQALKDNAPFKGLRGEQKETRDLWSRLMDERRNVLRGQG